MSVQEFVEICDRFTTKSLFVTDSAGRLMKDRYGNISNLKIAIIDYGLGNLASVYAAFKKQCTEVRIYSHPEEMIGLTHLVLPGVGAFSEGMKNLRERGWESYLKESLSKRQIPLLGICLGMQLLASSGEEGGLTEGLNLIPGKVVLLKSEIKSCPIPHVGWNSVEIQKDSRLLIDIPSGSDFYFVHSFSLRPMSSGYCIGETCHSEKFCSVVENGAVFGVQFHPEKSSKVGALLIRNFLAV